MIATDVGAMNEPARESEHSREQSSAQSVENAEHRTRTRTIRRAVERIDLSDREAGARVVLAVRRRVSDGAGRVVIASPNTVPAPEMMEHAFDALRYSELVCAPSIDGRVELLGMTEPLDLLLTAIPWDTSNALDALLSAARSARVSVLLLPPAEHERVSAGS